MLYVKPNELRILWRQYVKNWWMFAVSVGGCLLLALAFTLIKSQKFEVYTSVDIADGGGSSNMMAAMAKNSGFSDILGMGGTEVDNEIVIMSSHHVIRNAVKRIGMNVTYDSRPKLKRVTYWGDCPIEITNDTPGFSDTLSVGLYWKVKVSADGKKADIVCKNSQKKKLYDKDDVALPATVETGWGTFQINTTQYFVPGEKQKFSASWYSYTNIAQGLMNRLTYGLIEKKAHVVMISNEDVNPNRTISLLNAIVDEYERFTIETKNDAVIRNMDFVQERIDTVAAQLAALDAQLEAFKKANKISDVEKQAALVVQKSSDIEDMLLQLELGINNIDMLQKYLNEPTNRYAPLPLATNAKAEGTNIAIQEYNAALNKLNELKLTTSASNPTIQSMERALEQSRQALSLTFDNAKRDLEFSAKRVGEKDRKLSGMVNGIPEVEREYVSLVRKQELKQKVYLMLLSQQEQNSVNLSVDAPKAHRVDEAYVNVLPSGPSRGIVLIIGLFLGLFMPMAFLKVKDMLNPLLNSPEQIRLLDGLEPDIHLIQDNDSDMDQLAYSIAQSGKNGQAKVTFMTLQGEAEGLYDGIIQRIGRFANAENVNVKNTPAFIESPEAMYELANSNLAVIGVQEGKTEVDHLKYIETLAQKELLKHVIIAYIAK